MKNEIGPVVDDCAGWMFQLVVGDLGDLVGVNPDLAQISAEGLGW